MITPLCTEYMNAQTDGLATLEASSLGATAADFGCTLSEKYISRDIVIFAYWSCLKSSYRTIPHLLKFLPD